MPVKQLTEKQKKNLPVALQKAIMAKRVKMAKAGGQLHGEDLKKSYMSKK